MRLFISILIFIFYALSSSCQIRIDADLGLKLDGKTKFQEIKSTVWSDLTEKLAALEKNDSVGRKSILRQMKKWNREFWINEYYTNGKGEVKPHSKVVMDALEIRNREESRSGSRAQAENWISNGPISTNFSTLHGEGVGRIDRLAFHPNLANTMWAGSPFGGLFKTTDGGANWYPISSFVASLGVSGIAINYNNPNIIYVLSGDGDSNGGCFNGGYCLPFGELRSASNGVYKTVNGGESWTKLPDFPDVTNSTIYQGRNLIIHPTDPTILFAATSRGLYKTIDSGANWTKVTIGNENIWDVKFKPGNPQTMYCVGNDNIKRSTNYGNNFIQLAVDGLNLATRISIAVTPANPNKIALLAGRSNNQNSLVGVFISSTSGDNFDLTYNDNDDNLFYNYIDLNNVMNQVDYDNVIAISPVDENIILAGGLCLWRSEDGGYDWSQETAYWPASDFLHEYIHPDQHFLAYAPNGALYVANDGGVYVSYLDNGDDWDFIETGLSATQFYHFEWENDEGDPWGGAQDNGILQRINYYEYTTYWGGDGYDVMTDHPWRAANGNSDDIYYTVNEIIRSDDTDISVPQNVCDNCPKNFFGNLAMDPMDENIIYVGYQIGLFRSTNAGDDWTSIGTQPSNWSISTCPSDPDIVYVAGATNTNNGLIQKYNAPNWEPINNPPSPYTGSLKITDIEVDPLISDLVYISVGGVVPNAKVFTTSTGGSSWENISFNLPNVPVFCIKKDEFNGLYVGTSIGVYYKRAGISHWEPYYNGLPPVPVTQIEIEGNFVHISTFGRGLWTTLKYTSCIDNLELSGQAVGRNYYEASADIQSSQTILGSPGTNIIYSAGNKITFLPGTHIQLSAKFNGVVQPCGSEVDLSKPSNPKKKAKKQKASIEPKDIKE